jgi:hypothetical protein
VPWLLPSPRNFAMSKDVGDAAMTFRSTLSSRTWAKTAGLLAAIPRRLMCTAWDLQAKQDTNMAVFPQLRGPKITWMDAGGCWHEDSSLSTSCSRLNSDHDGWKLRRPCNSLCHNIVTIHMDIRVESLDC